TGKADESRTLAAELALLDAKLEGLARELEEGDSVTISKVVKRLEAGRKDLAARLAEARQKEANPRSAVWGEMQSIIAVLDDAADPLDTRIRLRSALRGLIEDIHLLVVPRGHDRVGAVQIAFRADEGEPVRQRSYLILSRAPRANAASRTEGQWWCK